MGLASSSGGQGPALLVVLHGLGATRQVWTPFLARAADHWSGRWLAIDLPGHGGSPPTTDYRPAAQARLVAPLIEAAQADGPLVVLGHSLGGVIAMALAAGQEAVQPHLVAGLGVKVAWPEADVAGLGARASVPPKSFEARSEAVERFLKAAGLAGLADAEGALAQSGVTQGRDGRWRLAMDPQAYALGEPPIASLVNSAKCPIRLASGSGDAMSPREDLVQYDPGAVELPGLGHNAMIEDPESVWAWLSGLLERRRHVGR